MMFSSIRVPLSLQRFLRRRSAARNAHGNRLARLELLESRHLLAGDTLLITEFMASNDTALLDRFGDSSDWIEVHNPSASAISLAGWFLTDDADNLDKWQLPDVTIPGHGYLVVFASGASLADPLDELHTNFKLSSNGEYLGLARPDMTVAHDFGPTYPSQFTDVSYGLDSDLSVPDVAAGFLNSATPGAPNGQVRSGVTEFSQPSGTFTDPFSVTLTSADPTATIHFTTEGNEPTETSEVYTGPLTLSSTTHLRAIAVVPGRAASFTTSVRYTKVAPDLQTITSNLPIVVLENFGAGQVTVDPFQFTALSIFQPDDITGRSSVVRSPDLETRAGIKVRGSTTVGRPKQSFAVEAWDERNNDKDITPLGLPSESDWILYAPFDVDRAMLRNPFIFELSNQIGRYAVRTRFVEVYHNFDGGELSTEDYRGLYVLMEKIKRGSDRVNVRQLARQHDREPEMTGGWILKIDRPDPGDTGFRAAGQVVQYVNPKEVDVTPVQADWIENYLDQFAAALTDTNPETGYARFIDVDSWIDHHILNVLAMNADGLRLSTFFYKDRGGKIEMGPIWDFDRAMGSEDDRNRDPEVWNGANGTDFFRYPWWRQLFQDPDFWQTWIDRWFELRQEVLTAGNFAATIDSMAAQISEAQTRNFDRWPRVRPNGGRFAPSGLRTWEAEVTHLKGWLSARLSWIDSQFVPPPTIRPSGGKLQPGQAITMSSESGMVYYTTDGSDPRADGGEVSANAVAFVDPVTLSGPATVNARVKEGSNWSAPTTVFFLEEALADRSNLRVTELNYNPHAALTEQGELARANDDFEFIELTNVGSQPIDLDGVQLVEVPIDHKSQGVQFTFASQMLDPGERLMVVANREAFQSRYGTSVRIADGDDGQSGDNGQFAGQLNNVGETIKLVDKFGRTIQRFHYDESDRWPGRANGRGSSLEAVDPDGDYSDPGTWRSSSEFGGSPGTVGQGPDNRIVVNEILAHTRPTQLDMVELHNTSTTAIDINYWYISDSTDDYFKFQVIGPTRIQPNGYQVFTEAELGFDFSGAYGGELWLIEADSNGRPARFVHRAEFRSSSSGISLGRWPNRTGSFFPMDVLTFGHTNTGPRRGDVIISEVHYRPLDPDGNGKQTADDVEFVELYNRTDRRIDLTQWRLAGGVEMTFPSGTTVDPHDSLLVVPFDATDPNRSSTTFVFRFAYNLGPSVPLIGPYLGNLDDGGGTLRLERPDEPPADDPDFAPYVWVDEMDYREHAPWPTSAGGAGDSLHRATAASFGKVPASWIARSPKPGPVDFIMRQPGDANDDGQFDQKDVQIVLQGGKYRTGYLANWTEGDWNGDGVFDQLDLVEALQAGTYSPVQATL